MIEVERQIRGRTNDYRTNFAEELKQRSRIF